MTTGNYFYFSNAGLANGAKGFPQGNTGQSLGYREQWFEIHGCWIKNFVSFQPWLDPATSSAVNPGGGGLGSEGRHLKE